MTPFKLGISVGTSGAGSFQNYLKTATGGLNTAGAAGGVGARGVSALGAASSQAAGGVGNLNAKLGMARVQLQGAGAAGTTGAKGVGAVNQSATTGVAGLQNMIARVQALRVQAAALQPSGAAGAAGIGQINTSAATGVAGLQQMINRIQALKTQSKTLQTSNTKSRLSFASLGWNARLTGGFIQGLGMGGIQLAKTLGGNVLGAVGDLTSKLGGLGQGALGTLFNIKTMALGLGAGLLGGALIQTNRSLENQTLSMGALIASNVTYTDSTGKVLNDQKSLNEALSNSSKLINQYRRDALKGAGSTEERILVTNATIQKILGEAGGNIETVRLVANQVVTTSKLVPQLANDANQASRDAAAILSGQAGNDVALFNFLKGKLGNASEFNKLTAPDRLAKFQAAMQVFATGALIDASANTFDGLTSSLNDFVQLVTQTLGGGLFKQVKLGLKGIIEYLVADDGSPTKAAQQIQNIGAKIGNEIALVAGKVTNFLVEMSPKIVELGNKTVGFFKDYVQPVLAAIVPVASDVFNLLVQGFSLVSSEATGTDTAFRDGLVTLAKMTAVTVGFIALGLAGVVAAIGAGIFYAVKGWGIFTQEINKRGGDITGFFTLLSDMWEGAKFLFEENISNPIRGFWNGLVTWVNNALDDTYIALLRFGQKTMSVIDQIPLLGKALGWSGLTGLGTTALDSLILDTQIRRNQRTQQAAITNNSSTGVNVQVQQTITAPNPTAAAAAANRGVGFAVQKAVPGAGRVGQPIIGVTP